MQRLALHPRLRQLLTLLPLVPLLWLFTEGALNHLGPDPGKALVHGLGLWALRLLLITLAISPLNRFTPVQWLPLRRTFGLYALGYAVLHVLGYAFFFLGFDIALLANELVKRPYIVLGSLALLMLTALGLTSTRRWQQRLGKRWKYLHKLIYPAAALVILHFAWQVKSGFGMAPWYALVLLVLLALRWR